MDPNLFHIDWDRLAEVLVVVTVLAFFLERALALIFEHKYYVTKLKDTGLKEPIAFVAALVVCWTWDFDALSMVLLREKITFFGQIITAAVIAGGSKASLKLFKDVMKMRSGAELQLEKEAAAKAKSNGP